MLMRSEVEVEPQDFKVPMLSHHAQSMIVDRLLRYEDIVMTLIWGDLHLADPDEETGELRWKLIGPEVTLIQSADRQTILTAYQTFRRRNAYDLDDYSGYTHPKRIKRDNVYA